MHELRWYTKRPTQRCACYRTGVSYLRSVRLAASTTKPSPVPNIAQLEGSGTSERGGRNGGSGCVGEVIGVTGAVSGRTADVIDGNTLGDVSGGSIGSPSVAVPVGEAGVTSNG